MRLETLSVFPEVFSPYLNASIMGRAQKAHIFEFYAHDLRDWTHDRHRTVDDAPFGGGQGMLMKPAPIFEAVREISDLAEPKPHVVFFSPVGRPYSQAIAQEFAQKERILFVCGRYEGMDERVYELADEVISLGDYVLTGGELPALCMSDAISRNVPGVLGNDMSLEVESFEGDLLEAPSFTKPSDYKGSGVVSAFLKGDHAKIRALKNNMAFLKTRFFRPDLYRKFEPQTKEKI